MRKLIITCLIFTFSTMVGHNKYMIYFSDKGGLNKESLSKSIDKENLAKQFLSEKSIERRKRNLGDDYFTFEDLPIESQYLKSLSENGIKIVNKLKWFNAVSAYLTEDQLHELNSKSFIKKIEKIRKVKSIEPVNEESQSQKLLKSSAAHTLNYGNSLTQNELSNIPAVHDMGITGEGVVIGLLDTGFDWETHDALKERNVIAEYDFVYKDNKTANDDKDISGGQHNHGTSVFSIIAGFDEGNLIGPAFGAQFLLAKTEFISSETHTEEDNYAAALEWMDSIGVDITSSSLGYSEFDATDFSYTYADMNGSTTIVTKAAELAFDRGIVVITSAGNEGDDPWKYITAPGDGFNTITVGAVTSSNAVTYFSSRGPTFDGRIKPEIVAMGSSVINARAGTSNIYGSGAGTSYSAPISAGIAGLLLSAYPHLSNKQVRAIFLESCDNVQDPNNDRGYGLISALKAVTYPNLEIIDSDSPVIINKMFNPRIDIDKDSVEIFFDDGSSYKMTKFDNIFSTELSQLVDGNTYNFHFKYKDILGNNSREPENKNYSIKYIHKDLLDNKLQNAPHDPFPSNGSTNKINNILLTWKSTDPDGDNLEYDIYFGKNSDPQLVMKNSKLEEYSPGILNENTTYYWKIVSKDNRGNYVDGPLWSFTNSDLELPDNYSLSQNYPNPSNPVTFIDYSIPKSVENVNVSIKLFDALGRSIKTLYSGEKIPGNYTLEINTKLLSSGVYFYQLKSGSFTQTKKLTILK